MYDIHYAVENTRLAEYNVSPGDKVTVQMEESTGMKAVVLSYLVPVLIIMGGLFVLQSLPVNELFAGLRCV